MSKTCRASAPHLTRGGDDLLKVAGRGFLAGTLSVALSTLPCSAGVAYADAYARMGLSFAADARGNDAERNPKAKQPFTPVQKNGAGSTEDRGAQSRELPSNEGSEGEQRECEVFLEAWAGDMRIRTEEVLSRGQHVEVRVWGSGLKTRDALPADARVLLSEDSCGGCATFGRDWTVEEGADGPTFCLQTTDELMDGSYTLTVEVQDTLGHARSSTWDITVDTLAPELVVDELGAPVATREDRAYYGEARAIGIRIADANLDTQRTTVNGTCLCDLLDPTGIENDSEGVRYEPWVTSVDADGTTTYSSVASFGDGVYDLPVVRAVDLAGNESCDSHSYSSFVVDTGAPAITATASNVPSFVFDNEPEGSQMTFFNAPTTVDLRFEDLSGVVSADCAGVPAGVRMDVWPSKDGATVRLGTEPLANTARVVVADLCGNVAIWSLMEEGEHRTAAGVASVANEPLRVSSTGDLVSRTGHPTLLLEDLTPPLLNIAGVKEGAYLREGQHLRIEAYDQTLGYVATCDPGQQVVRVLRDGVPVATHPVAYAGARRGDVSHVYDVPVVVDASTHENDGRYEVRVRMMDMAQNAAPEQTRSFTIDTTPPVLRVAFEDQDDGAGNGGGYFGGPRRAHVSVVDKSLSVQKLNEGRLVRVEPSGRDGCTSADALVGAWRSGSDPDEYCCDVEFLHDGTYSLQIAGVDDAGNPLVGAEGTKVSDNGAYDSGEFVIDTTQPSMTFAYEDGCSAPHAFAGMDYFCKPVLMRVTVVDRNLDASRTTVTDSQGRERTVDWEVSEPAADGNVTYSAVVAYSQRDERDGGRMAPEVHAQDLAGNEASRACRQFVVDQDAPYVSRVLVSKEPSAQGRASWGADPVWFYNLRDGHPVTIAFEFGDEYLIDQAWVEDPHGIYEVTWSDVHGKAYGRTSLTLRNHDGDETDRDAVWSREVRLWVRDMAGNTRWWSLSPTGAIVADHVGDTANVSLGNEGEHPLALVLDGTAPRVSVSGVEDGGMYNDTRIARMEVREYGFDFIRRYDPSRTIATVRREEGREGGETTEWKVVARQFEQEGDVLAFEQAFEADGRYSLDVSFEDYAGNPSNAVSVGEFVVDKTAPAISVSWDNNAARNGRYFSERRTATVTVVEHNFDPGLMSVTTTGAYGEWVSMGDTHTLTVSFAADAAMSDPHRLRVAGRDQAGNEAAEYVEPDFAIDTKPPTVEIRKRVSESGQHALGNEESELEDKSAFAYGMMPVVELVDEAGFDASSVEVEIRGKRDAVAEPSFLARNTTMLGSNGMRVDWGNIGLVEDEDGVRFMLDADDVYTVTAQVRDMAGNASERKVASFSLNRFGSNFFFENTDGLVQGEDGTWTNAPLPKSPHIVVHEVNVSGVPEQGPYSGEDARMVTKEYANATKRLVQTEDAEPSGYTAKASTEPSAHNPYEGWWECTYTISPGNFGKGSDSDHGDGGQGLYRVDVSSRDKASNNNTTSAYWGSGVLRTERDGPADERNPSLGSKSATVAFTLDEFGPTVEDVNLPMGLTVGDTYRASFRVVDRITRGDRISVTIDGEEVPVCREGSFDPLGPQEIVGEGVYTFQIAPKPAYEHRRAQIRVWDYTDLQSRAQVVDLEGFGITTLVVESLLVLATAGAIGGACMFVRWRRGIADPPVPHGR